MPRSMPFCRLVAAPWPVRTCGCRSRTGAPRAVLLRGTAVDTGRSHCGGGRHGRHTVAPALRQAELVRSSVDRTYRSYRSIERFLPADSGTASGASPAIAAAMHRPVSASDPAGASWSCRLAPVPPSVPSQPASLPPWPTARSRGLGRVPHRIGGHHEQFVAAPQHGRRQRHEALPVPYDEGDGGARRAAAARRPRRRASSSSSGIATDSRCPRSRSSGADSMPRSAASERVLAELQLPGQPGQRRPLDQGVDDDEYEDDVEDRGWLSSIAVHHRDGRQDDGHGAAQPGPGHQGLLLPGHAGTAAG